MARAAEGDPAPVRRLDTRPDRRSNRQADRPAGREGPARRQLRAWLDEPLDGAAVAALTSAHGLWAACREAARSDDTAFLEHLATIDISRTIDDELPAFPGPKALARAEALLDVATWWSAVRRPAPPAAGRLLADLEHAAAAFTPPGMAAWSALDLPFLPQDTPSGTAELLAVVAELVRQSGHPGLVCVHDLLADIDRSPTDEGPAPVRVLLTIAGTARPALVRLRRVDTTLGLFVDAATTPFLRWDRPFEDAVQRAWWAAGQPALAARWSLHWEDSGDPVQLIEGASAGLAVALAAAATHDPERWAYEDNWVVTGNVDEAGTVGSLLARDGRLTAASRDKLTALTGRDRTLVLPASDAAETTAFCRRAGLSIELRPVSALDDLSQPAPPSGAEPAETAEAADGPAHPPHADGAPTVEPVCPYKGLATFSEDDAAWFHGRERMVARLVGQLRTRHLVGVVGPSGAGKSSLVRAGLLPALRRGALPGSAEWETVVLVPGTDAWRALHNALDGRLPRVTTTATAGGSGPPEADDLVEHWLARFAARDAQAPTLLLVLDQFEELFTLCPPEQTAAVLRLLAEACAEPSGLRTVPIVRADFYANVSVDERFAALLSQDHVLVGPMTATELRRAITAPARACGLQLEERLVDAVFDDVVGQPAALPYLSTALQETWARRRGDTLTLDGYLEAGGVAHAIARLADDLVAATPSEIRPELRALFLRLLETEDAQAVVRRPAQLSELSDAQRTLVPDLLDRRLLVADGQHIELAHDSLVLAWPALREWLAEQYDDVRLHVALANRVREWDANQRSDDLLERGNRLSQFGELAERRPELLNATESAFVAASVRARRQADAARVAAAARTRRLLVATSVALVVALIGATVAFTQRNRAEQRKQEAQAAQVAQRAGQQAARAQGVLRGDSRALAALLSLAALDAAPNFEAVAGLAAALSSFDRPVDTSAAHADDISSAAMSGDGTTLVTGGWDRTVRVWDAGQLTERAVLQGADPAATDLALAPDGHAVAGTACDLNPTLVEPCPPAPLRVWSLEDATPTAEPRAWSTGYGDRRVAWTDAEHLVVAHREGISFWTEDGRSSGSFIPAAAVGPGDVYTVATGPGGLVAAATSQGVVRWWRVGQDPAAVVGNQLAMDGPVYALAFSHDGRQLAATDGTGALAVLDVATGQLRTGMLTVTDDEPLWAIAFSADDSKIVVGGGARPARQKGDNDLRMYSTSDGLLLRRFAGLGDVVRGIGFRADGRILAVTTDRRIRVFEDVPTGLNWELPHQLPCPPKSPAPEDAVWWITETGACWLTSVAIRPDQEQFVTSGWDRTLTVWDRTSLRPVVERFDPDPTPATPPEVPYWDWAKRAALSPDGRQVATPTDDGGIQLWELDDDSLEPTRRLAGTMGAEDADGEPVLVNAVAFSPDGAQLATANQDGGVDLWDVASGRRRWQGSHGPPTWTLPTYALDVSFSPDGRRLVTPGGDARIRVWNTADGSEAATSAELSYVQTATAWSPDGQLIFSAGADGLLRVWNADLVLQREFTLGATAIPSAVFTSDSNLLVMGDQERVVRVVDVASGRELAAFPVPFEPLQTIVTPDATEILVTDKGGAVRSYAGPARWAQAACALSGRNLSQAEWDGFVGVDRPYTRLCPDLPSGEGAPPDAPAAVNLDTNIAASLRASSAGS